MNLKLVPKIVFVLLIYLNGHRLSNQLIAKRTTVKPLLNDLSTSTASQLCANSNYADRCIVLGKKSYIIESKEKKNWHEAERFCRRQKGFLVNIENAREMDLILDYLKSKKYDGDNNSFYIGGNDLNSEGTFYSIGTGELMPYTRWLPGEPSNGHSGENCVHLWKVNGIYAMNDERCSNLDHYICELKDDCYRN